MWTISQLKQRGKAAFKRNYWKCVLIGLLVTGLAMTVTAIVERRLDQANDEFEQRSYTDFPSLYDNGEDAIQQYRGLTTTDYVVTYDVPKNTMMAEDTYADDFSAEGVFQSFLDGLDYFGVACMVMFLGFVFLVVSIAINVFIMNPLQMGGCRFFFCNLQQPADVKELCFGYDRNYRNVVRVLFFRDLYLCLWTLLFIIPGIVKAYEYRMIPYLLAEHPDMPKEQAFATSRQMMYGEKGRAFLLDLSFIGWILLAACTCNIVGIFYFTPYKMSTNAALYEFLKYNKGTSTTSYYSSVPPVTPIPGFENGSQPMTPPMDAWQQPVLEPSETTVETEPEVEAPEVTESPLETEEKDYDPLSPHMFEED